VVHPRHVYVHVPFCARRCTYCDFSIAVRRVVPVEEYAAALSRELNIRFPGNDSWVADTFYLGGGTPSRLGADGVPRVIDLLRDRITLEPNAEVTLEANPDDITRDAARAWRSVGVNRLSIGAQSFDDAVLAWMHRTHDAIAIERAVERARAAGIENISIDLIFALPAAITRSWSDDLRRALALAPAHLSFYGLTIEPHTPLGRASARGELVESPDERYEAEFIEAHETLAAAGFDHYEVSNFGLAGAHSRHNTSYWSSAPYAGLGPSAHEFDGHRRRANRSAYTEWLGSLTAGRDPIGQQEELTPANRVAERIYLGLRTADGLLIAEREVDRVTRWVEAGWATLADCNRLRLTAQGWLRLDALAADLTLIRSRY
jgi:oxygen-independent coproporphyrinogen-3 oxidase